MPKGVLPRVLHPEIPRPSRAEYAAMERVRAKKPRGVDGFPIQTKGLPQHE